MMMRRKIFFTFGVSILFFPFLVQSLDDDPRKDPQLFVEKKRVTETGRHISYRQKINSIPVFGRTSTMHRLSNGLFFVTGNSEPLTQVDTSYQMNRVQAELVGKRLLHDEYDSLSLTEIDAEKVIYAEEVEPVAAWQVTLTGTAVSAEGTFPLVERLIIDDDDGRLLLKYPLLVHATALGSGHRYYDQDGEPVSFNTSGSGSSYTLHDEVRNAEVLSAQNGVSITDAVEIENTSTDWDSESYLKAIELAHNAELTFDYFFDAFGRIGYDDAGGVMNVIVDFGENYANAFSTENTIAFGDGDGTNQDFSGSLDIVGHEYAHSVIGETSDLIYYGESGAINESFADMMGTAIEQDAYQDGHRDNADWLIGSDFEISNGAIRDMCEPSNYGDPDHYSQFLNTTDDNAGVHTNSGIGNAFFCLLSEGGTNTTSGLSVSGIGIEMASLIVYTAMNDGYVSSTDDYVDFRIATELAVDSLLAIGSITATEGSALTDAWDAVGVTEDGMVHVAIDDDYRHVNGSTMVGYTDPTEVVITLTSSNEFSGTVSIVSLTSDDAAFEAGLSGSTTQASVEVGLPGELIVSIEPSALVAEGEYEWDIVLDVDGQQLTYPGNTVQVTEDVFVTNVSSVSGFPGDLIDTIGVNLNDVTSVTVGDQEGVFTANSGTEGTLLLNDSMVDGYIKSYPQGRYAAQDERYFQFDMNYNEPRELIVGTQYDSITSAIDDANDGDSIRIPGGEYEENMIISSDVTIEATDSKAVVTGGLRVDNATVAIDNVAFADAVFAYGPAVSCENGSITLTNSAIRDMVSENDSIIDLDDCAFSFESGRMTGNTAQKSLLVDGGTGQSGTSIIASWIADNTADSNSVGRYPLLQWTSRGTNRLINSVVVNNQSYRGVVKIADKDWLNLDMINVTFADNSISRGTISRDPSTLVLGMSTYSKTSVYVLTNVLFDDAVLGVFCNAGSCILDSTLFASVDEESYNDNFIYRGYSETESLTALPEFTDAASNDYSIGEDSPAYETGFDTSHIEGMSLQDNYHRGAHIEGALDFDDDGDGFTVRDEDPDDTDPNVIP
jgi:Zn-dependent metalloprotease